MRYTELFEKVGQAVPFDQLPHYKELLTKGKWILFPNQSINSFHGCPDSVEGDFVCAMQNELKSMQYAPQHVGGKLRLVALGVESLVGGPQTVGGTVELKDLQIESLEGGPTQVGGMYSIETPIASLRGAPQVINGDFNIDHAEIKNFVGGPQVVHGRFYAWVADLESYEGAPKEINGDVVSYLIPSLTNFHKNFHTINGELLLSDGPANGFQMPTNVLGILAIAGLKLVKLGQHKQLNDILNKYLPMGKKGMMQCQTELIKAGFKEQAKL